jgi:hypothetical protein
MMNDREESGQAGPPSGLCGVCAHARVITSDRRARFILCEKSKTDARFPRYPALPVIRCAGYEPAAAGSPR